MSKRQKRNTRNCRASPGRGRRLLRIGAICTTLSVAVAIIYSAFIGGQIREIRTGVAGAVAGTMDRIVSAAGFAVQDVTVSGRRYTFPHEVLGALNINRGDSIISFDPSAARERVLALQWVRDASVKRLFPDTIHVTIEEHKPFAIWQTGSGATIIDERGAVVNGFDVSTLPQLPIVVGPGAAKAAPAFLSLLNARPAIGDHVRAAIRVGERRWTLKLDNGIDVLLPEEGVEVALDELIRIDESTDLLRRDVKLIDLRLADRVVVLPRLVEGESTNKVGAQNADTVDNNT